VVVGTELEADDDVDRVTSRREHQDRHEARAPDLPADLEPIEFRKHDVEDDEVIWLSAEAHQTFPPVCRRLDAQARPP
jgi:hypothetical protein